MINDWLSIPYAAYGRGREGSDCWGLVCIVREAVRGDVLPAFADIQDKRALTHAAHDMIAQGWREVSKPKVGTLVAVWRGALCMHIGIVIEIDGRMAVIDSDEKRGVAWKWLTDYLRQHAKVTLHDN